MSLQRPHRALLHIWRLVLLLCSAIPAFLISALCVRRSLLWTWLYAAWGGAFLFLFSLYLPALFRRKTFRLEEDRLSATGGFLLRTERILPVSAIRFISVSTLPLGRFFGICNVLVLAAGGRMLLQGLSHPEGERLAAELSRRAKFGGWPIRPPGVPPEKGV